jgi:mRNA interferase HigB
VVNVVALRTLRIFWETHPESETVLRAWYKRLQHSRANHFEDLKADFPSIDVVQPFFTVFDIAGNAYRVVTRVDYKSQFIKIRFVFTHKEYDQWNKKGHPDVKDSSFKREKTPLEKVKKRSKKSVKKGSTQ